MNTIEIIPHNNTSIQDTNLINNNNLFSFSPDEIIILKSICMNYQKGRTPVLLDNKQHAMLLDFLGYTKRKGRFTVKTYDTSGKKRKSTGKKRKATSKKRKTN